MPAWRILQHTGRRLFCSSSTTHGQSKDGRQRLFPIPTHGDMKRNESGQVRLAQAPSANHRQDGGGGRAAKWFSLAR